MNKLAFADLSGKSLADKVQSQDETLWKELSKKLTTHYSVPDLAADLKIPQKEIQRLLEQHANEVRVSPINARNGDRLYIRKNMGLRPRIREILGLMQLGLR